MRGINRRADGRRRARRRRGMGRPRDWIAIGLVMGILATGCGSSAGSHPAASSAGTSAAGTGGGATTGSTAGGSAGSSTPGEPITTPSTAPASGPASQWLSYHADGARTGAVAAGTSPNPAQRRWNVNLGGAVYGQPVVTDGRVIAATENNRVVALDPATGAIEWSVTLGAPLTNVGAVAGCGDIDPLGITSAPAVDPTTGTVYVVGEVSAGGTVHHQLEGIAVATGKVVLSEAVDPPLPAGESPVTLLQRVALTVANGRVYVGYGGNFGDCGHYHGWVVGVNESGTPDMVSFEVAADGEGGAVWQSGGAPAVDPQGNLFVTTGNADPYPPEGGPDPLKYTESIVKLTPALRPLASFKDRVAGSDEDLSTVNPVLLPGGLVFVVGKTDIGYLLQQQDLSQVAAIQGVCSSSIPDGGPAWDAATSTLFVPCRGGGLQEVDVANRTLGPRLSGADSAPILVAGGLWAPNHHGSTLNEFDPATGKRIQTVRVGTSLPTFATPSAALGLILIGTTKGVAAFGSPAGA